MYDVIKYPKKGGMRGEVGKELMYFYDVTQDTFASNLNWKYVITTDLISEVLMVVLAVSIILLLSTISSLLLNLYIILTLSLSKKVILLF